MRKSFFLVLGLWLLAGPLGAQSHNNTTENKANDQMTLTSNVRIGATMVQAGDYRVICDRTKITFTRLSDGKRVADVECKGLELTEKAKETVAVTDVDQAGVRFLKKLLLRGSNIEHVFN